MLLSLLPPPRPCFFFRVSHVLLPSIVASCQLLRESFVSIMICRRLTWCLTGHSNLPIRMWFFKIIFVMRLKSLFIWQCWERTEGGREETEALGFHSPLTPLHSPPKYGTCSLFTVPQQTHLLSFEHFNALCSVGILIVEFAFPFPEP